MVPLIDTPRFTLRVHLGLPLLWLWALWGGREMLFAVTFAGVTLHELCHAGVLRLWGYPIHRIDLSPIGAFLSTEAELEQKPAAEASTAFAGPLFHLLAAVLLELAVMHGWAWAFAPEAIRIQVVLFLFNLIPALPMDGGHILRASLCRRLGLGRASRITACTGFVCAALIAAWGIFLWAAAGILQLQWFCIPAMIVVRSLNTLRSAAWLGIRSGEMRRRELLAAGLLSVRNLVLSPTTRISTLLPRLAPRSYHIFTVVDETGRVLGSFTEEHLIAHLHCKNPVTAGEILFPGACGISWHMLQYIDSVKTGDFCPQGSQRRFHAGSAQSHFTPGVQARPLYRRRTAQRHEGSRIRGRACGLLLSGCI